MHKKRGQYFEIDAIIALSILIIGIVYIRNLNAETFTVTQNKVYSEETIKLFGTLKIGELNGIVGKKDVADQWISNSVAGPLTQKNNTIAKQIAVYYTGLKDNVSYIAPLVQETLINFIPPNYQYCLHMVDGDNTAILYDSTSTLPHKDAQGKYLFDKYLPADGECASQTFNQKTTDLSVSRLMASNTQKGELYTGLIEIWVWKP